MKKNHFEPDDLQVFQGPQIDNSNSNKIIDELQQNKKNEKNDRFEMGQFDWKINDDFFLGKIKDADVYCDGSTYLLGLISTNLITLFKLNLQNKTIFSKQA